MLRGTDLDDMDDAAAIWKMPVSTPDASPLAPTP